MAIEAVENIVEKWKTLGRKRVRPVENNVEKWITPCKGIL